VSEGSEAQSSASAADASGQKPTKRRVSITAAAGIFVAVLGVIGTLPGLKSYADNRVHGLWASWLLLAAGLLVLFGAILLIMHVRAMIASLGDKTWDVLARILAGVIPFVALLGVIFAGIDIKDAVAEPVPAALTTVQLAVGSENVPFFTDPEVQQVFRGNGYNVQVTGFGSRELASKNFATSKPKYDAVVPSSQIAASQLEDMAPFKGQPEIALFRSPLVLATYSTIASCLQSLGIVSQSQGIWWFSVANYLTAVADKWDWSMCPSSVAPLTGRILVSTTNPQCSNSGEIFMADASYVAHHGLVVADPGTATEVGDDLAPLVKEQGYMEYTTNLVFQDYLVEGVDYTPMAVIYEAQFLGEKITQPGAMNSQQGVKMVLMYLTPNIFSQRMLIPFPGDSAGAAVGHLVADNPQLEQLAQEKYGFRYSDPVEFSKIIRSHGITVPLEITQGKAPDPTILGDIINAADPGPAGNDPAC
jgi:hypothetical protein